MPRPPRPTLYTDRCGSPRLVPGCPTTTRRPPHRPAARTAPTRVVAPGGFPPRPHASAENEQGPAQGAGARRVPAPAAAHQERDSRADTRGSIHHPAARTSRRPREEQGTSPPASASRPATQGPTGPQPADSRPPPPRPRSPLHPPPSPLVLAGGRMAQPSHVREAPGVSCLGAKSRRGALSIQKITSIQIWR
ncbi:proline-rich protein 2-like [Bubalus bubalis]|uniref:proline-rich protein 2-like n=1 Tax=Bubalus bubalis TaxID=89462 RepID=UPI001E1B8105|nr:proline-rich protein 2-like [Bubalus bubalis]